MYPDLLTAAITMKNAVTCPNMVTEPGFKEGFSVVSLYLDVPCNCTHTPRAKHILLRYFLIQDLVGEVKITIHYEDTQDQLVDLGIKYLGKHCYRALIKLNNDFEA